MMVEIILGDCLEVMPTLPAQSVDAIITDLPYGTTQAAFDIENANVEIASLRAERDQAIEEARQYSARCDELAREVEQWQADRNVLQSRVDRLTESQVAMATHLHETQTALVEAEIAIRAMWPIFALALAYGEHGRSSEHNGLRKLAEEARNGGVPKHVMDIILDAAEGL